MKSRSPNRVSPTASRAPARPFRTASGTWYPATGIHFISLRIEKICANSVSRGHRGELTADTAKSFGNIGGAAEHCRHRNER